MKGKRIGLEACSAQATDNEVGLMRKDSGCCAVMLDEVRSRLKRRGVTCADSLALGMMHRRILVPLHWHPATIRHRSYSMDDGAFQVAASRIYVL
jgi:hypothetical protein